MSPPLDLVTEALAQRIAEIVLGKLLSANDVDGWIDQSKSPLGRRRHINLARKIGRQVGRRYFLPREAIDRAMAETTTKARMRKTVPADLDEELASELNLRVRAA